MTLSEELIWRDQLKDHTFQDVSWLDTPRTFYLGADCSADSLTIGNLAIYMVARRLAAAGWKPVLLVGGATSLIGDPGGKDAERDLKTEDEIATNVKGIQAQVERLLDGEVRHVNNYDWFKEVGYLQFLRDAGKHFSMTELLQRDYITERLGEGGNGISYAEFSYSLIQGYDYLHLNEAHGVELQIGGSDQWGNMLSGVPLIRKKTGREVHAFSMPLVINKATGKKFGKSEAGAVWLSPKRTTPTQFYQFWINVDDDGLESYLKAYTEFTPAEIQAILAEHQTNPAARNGQRRLAEFVTTLVHGEAATKTAKLVTEYLVGERAVGDITAETIEALRAEIPVITAATSITQTLVEAGLASSNSEARRLLSGNGISLNGVKQTEDAFPDEAFLNGWLLLRKGKKFSDSALVART